MSLGVQRMPHRDNGSTTIFRALGNYRRQAVILSVGPRKSKDLGDLAEAIGEREAKMDGEEYGSKVRKRVYVALLQTHLPKLEEWGLVEWDEDRKTVKGTWKAYAARWLVRVGKVIQ